MSPAKEPSNDRNQIEHRLAGEVKSAEESYRSTTERYLTIKTGIEAVADDSQVMQTVYSAAKDVRMARKRYRRATRVLASFTSST